MRKTLAELMGWRGGRRRRRIARRLFGAPWRRRLVRRLRLRPALLRQFGGRCLAGAARERFRRAGFRAPCSAMGRGRRAQRGRFVLVERLRLVGRRIGAGLGGAAVAEPSRRPSALRRQARAPPAPGRSSPASGRRKPAPDRNGPARRERQRAASRRAPRAGHVHRAAAAPPLALGGGDRRGEFLLFAGERSPRARAASRFPDACPARR